MNEPQMIVIHYTAVDTLSKSLSCFKPDKVASSRRYIKKFGNLNVGVHFVVDKNGDIYSLLPLNIMGRHVIGFNYTALGIENVAANKDGLTQSQVESNALLVNYILKKNPTVRYLLGHYEYMNKELPHFKLYKAKDALYRPTIKIDPGEKFMSKLRKILHKKYEIHLEK